MPFFGDQPFWGAMVAKAGAGPEPIHHKLLNSDNLSKAITFCQTKGAQKAAEELGRQIRAEVGSIHPLDFNGRVLINPKKKIGRREEWYTIVPSSFTMACKLFNLCQHQSQKAKLNRGSFIQNMRYATLLVSTNVTTKLT